MNFALLERIADAVLYEGYILYPYRPSSLKNRQRWNFGTLYPRTSAEQQLPPQPFSFQTQVLIAGCADSRLTARIRFLQLLPGANDDPDQWAQGVTRSATLEGLRLGDLVAGLARDLVFPPSPDEMQDGKKGSAPIISGCLHLQAEPLSDSLFRLTATFSNETPLPASLSISERQTIQARDCISAHLLLGLDDASFISLLDPPSQYKNDVAACMQKGVFPVLAGQPGDAARMLCSPIVIYDYPQTAPESAGDFFDGTEMDEMLALRVLTLTDQEKSEMRASDPRAAAILARVETLPGEHLLKLHGAVREIRPAEQNPPAASPPVPATNDAIDGRIDPWDPFAERPAVQSVRVFGVEVRCGDRVRLWPAKKADILDIAMNGKIAVIEAIEQDLEDNFQFAVVLEDDPGKDMGLLRQAGHRFFFSPDEIEPLSLEVP
ncbi:MAG TPA: hypothetical protein VHX13_12470 [Acidobacteriaceae bacterium]|jgi:hypothetical protein|nr:hypothetical protein [Acidobacteriaceae bacterium]